jgi:voltage-gated potassium channel
MEEQTRLERYEHQMEWWLAGAAIAFLVLFSFEVLAQPREMADTVVTWAVRCVWALFAVDYCVRLFLADRRLRWFVRHLLDLLIIILPALRPLRLLSLAVVIRALQRVIGKNIRGKVIAYTASGAVVIIYSGALAILDVERDEPCNEVLQLAGRCPSIKNFGDALWWSFTTVTTVGYGDTYPVSGAGRLVAVALMVAGVSLVGVVTATLASWIVQRVAQEDSASKAATAAQIDELREEIRRLTEAMPRSPTDPSPRAYGESDGRGRTNSNSMEGSGDA